MKQAQDEGLKGRDKAIQAARDAMSPRAKELAELERWYDGTQYSDMPDWFGARDRPLFERGPCIVYPFARSAIQSHVDLVLGEGRFPAITLGQHDGDSPWDDEEPLSDDDRAVANRFVVEVLRQSRFEAACRGALTAAMATRSACLLFGARNGRLFVDLVKSRWCEPEVDGDGAVTKIVVEYPYTKAERDPDGSWHLRAYLFRREIDDQRDVTYKPKPLDNGNTATDWVEDEERTSEHGLGFCPVVWYAYDKGCSVEGRIDGRALHEDLLDEIYALDFTLSLRHRSAIHCGEPQWVQQGVDPDFVAGPTGRGPMGVPATAQGGAYTDPQGDNPLMGKYLLDQQVKQQRGLQKSPDTIWRLPEGASASLLSLPPNALEALSEHARDLRIKLAESASVVFLDPGDIKYAAALSGKALETLRGRQLSRCDQIRIDVEDGLILPGVKMLLRIVATLSDSVRIPGLRRSLPLLSRYSEATEASVPDCSATWPPYFDVDHADIQAVHNTVRQDLDAGVIRRETAIAKVADFYGIEDLPAYLEQLEEERAKRAAELHDAMMAMAKDDDEDGDGPGSARPVGERGGAASGSPFGQRGGERGARRGARRGGPGSDGSAGADEER